MPNPDDENIEDLLAEITEDDDEETEELASGQEPQKISINPDEVDSSQTASDDTPIFDIISEVVGKFGGHADEIWAAIRSDREQIDDFLTILQDRISSVQDTKQYYIEAITSLLSTKANASINASRLLDSIAKMVSASKNVGDGSGAAPDLSSLLDLDDDGDVTFDPENP